MVYVRVHAAVRLRGCASPLARAQGVLRSACWFTVRTGRHTGWPDEVNTLPEGAAVPPAPLSLP